MFLSRFEQDISEFEFLPDRWLAWGRVYRADKLPPVLRYFFIRLPSYRMMQSCYENRPRWHQLYLTWSEPEEGQKHLAQGRGWCLDWICR